MDSTPFVSFIGSGNVAWHLAPVLDNAGFIVKEIYSRNPKHAEILTERLYQAEVKATLDFSTSDCSIFIIAVSDDAIQDVAQEIILPEDAVLIHTSGSQPLSILQFAATQHTGVLYPLQTFSKSKKIDFRQVPLFLESSDDIAERALQLIARVISPKVQKIGSEERKALHVAAVFASNFTNHMITIAGEILQKNGLKLELLYPLITETINKTLSVGPKAAQTGPARRGDLQILDNHLEFLNDDERLVELYKLISQHILDKYEPE
jgi:predicted short-subunit dehydrogenase-like oxidoreductase (DUF2520 family)